MAGGLLDNRGQDKPSHGASATTALPAFRRVVMALAARSRNRRVIMTEPSDQDRAIVKDHLGTAESWDWPMEPIEFTGIISAAEDIAAVARAEGRRQALMDAATALHGLPTPQVGQHPECIVLAMIEREAAHD
jgi:hypothetical protein